jgi:hypothetical protein
METRMDPAALRAAFDAQFEEPALEYLVFRFNGAFQRTAGDTHSAMAAVNELMVKPITYETLMGRLERAA